MTEAALNEVDGFAVGYVLSSYRNTSQNAMIRLIAIVPNACVVYVRGKKTG